MLCGSDRYPVKDPFVELLKSSMNTFLNAMTFPDKTFYPVYGAGLVIPPSGLAACYSYRDPHGAQSLERYARCGDFIREQCEAEPNMTSFIIGAASDASRC